MSESKIRDFLAANLDFLEEGLTLHSTEQRLPNTQGASGSIDVLARDKEENFVIIEIKRSNQAARQATQEVLKYAHLIKRTYCVQDSNIRLVIISTEWHELLDSFLEMKRISPYRVEGYELLVDDQYRPLTIREVKQAVNFSGLRMFESHLVFCYRTVNSRDRAVHLIQKRLGELQIINYVVIEMQPEPIRSMHISPYIAYLVIKRESIEHYRKTAHNSELLQECEGLLLEGYSTDDVLEVAESRFLTAITHTIECDELGTGNSARLFSLLNHGKWITTKISGYGVFAPSGVFDRDRLIRIVTGDSNDTIGSDIYFQNSGSTKSKGRLEAVCDRLREMFVVQREWAAAVDVIFEELSKSANDFEFTTRVYNPPESILVSLHKMCSSAKYHRDPLAFMPHFTIEIIYCDQAKTRVVYTGLIKWNGSPVDSNEFYRSVLKGKPRMIETILRGHPRFERSVMAALNLYWAVDRVVVFPNDSVLKKKSLIGPRDIPSEDVTLGDFIMQKFEIVRVVNQYLDETMIVVG